MSTSSNRSGRLRPLSSIQFTPDRKDVNKADDTLDLWPAGGPHQSLQ